MIYLEQTIKLHHIVDHNHLLIPLQKPIIML